MISKEIELNIKRSAIIQNIIGEYIGLTKIGANYKSCCPFHDDKTASFIVSPSKGIFKCFGCGKSGDSVGFVMESEKVSYPVALKIIAKKYNIEVPEKELSAEEYKAICEKEKAVELLKSQHSGFKASLGRNEKALDWLINDRVIKQTTIDEWGLGWCSAGFFQERVIYPIHDITGVLCGFTGRTLIPDFQPKFKNSSESSLFNKSELLFGLSKAKMKINKTGKCYIVEGQHDVLSMFQIGFDNVVAPSGTAITLQHIRQIKRFARTIVMLLDGDKAGLEATIKNITPMLQEQVVLRIVQLPDGADPDSFIRSKSNSEAKYYIESNEVDFIRFKTDYFAKEIQSNPTRKGELITEITENISLIHDKNVRKVYIQECSEIFGIKDTELGKDIGRLREKMKLKNEDGLFFAFDEAIEEIKLKKTVHILSKYEDVIDFHLNDCRNYIGMNGAVLPKNEILKLKKVTHSVIFDETAVGFDKKTKDETATVKNLKRLISFGIDVRMRDERETEIDEETGEISEADYINFTDWYLKEVGECLSAADDLFTNKALENIAELLSFLSESARMTKINNVVSAFKFKGIKLVVGDFKKLLGTFLKKNVKAFEKDEEVVEISGDNPMNLNKQQFNDLNRYQHYFDKNAIHHISKTGHIAKISNFTILPIIHSNTSNGHFKLFEMTNEFNLTVNISMDTKDLNDVKRFRCKVEEKGNFVFKGEQFELNNIKERLYSNTTYSNEIEQLGWQSEGFWAWADGLTTVDGKFTKTDDNGLISFGERNYLIKPFSNLYAGDKTAYLNEKKFLHKTSDTTFKDWSERYFNVFGDNAMLSICTLVTCFYSDAIFKIVHGELPMINYFGPKGTGKTQQADSLMAFFGEKQPVNNLSKVTIYGLSQTLKSFHNAFCLIDEYKNSIDMKYIEFLKSIYNRQGKIQGNFAQQGTKTEHIPINQMVLICGQDLPTLDVALLERCICLTAYKNDYTNEEVGKYKDLKDIEEKGFAHLTDDFLKYRQYVIDQFPENNNIVQTLISKRCSDVSVRLQKNLTTILTSYYILRNTFDFPFTFDMVIEFGIKVITEQQKFIESSDDLKNFWSIFATLIEQDRIKEGRNYILHDVCEIRYIGSDDLVQYNKGMMCLFLRWDGLYPMYAEYSRRSNMVALGEKTIQFYLEKTKYYQGKIRSKKFRDKITNQEWVNQAYCFDYGKMNINLIKSKNIETDNLDMTPNMQNPEVRENCALSNEAVIPRSVTDTLNF